MPAMPSSFMLSRLTRCCHFRKGRNWYSHRLQARKLDAQTVAFQERHFFSRQSQVGRAIRRLVVALRPPDHFRQAVHHRVLGGVLVAQAGCQGRVARFHAGRLVDGELFADGKMHGQVQEGIGLAHFRRQSRS
jgi:hypothetical protein